MNNRQAMSVVNGAAELMRSCRSHLLQVLENPYHFEKVCDALEARANMMQEACSRYQKRRKFFVRAQLFSRNGLPSKIISIVDGLPVHFEGKTVIHPNGKPWTRQEVAVEVAQHEIRMARKR